MHRPPYLSGGHEAHLAARGPLQGGQEAHEGGLAGPGGADDAVDGARGDVEGEAVQGAHLDKKIKIISKFPLKLFSERCSPGLGPFHSGIAPAQCNIEYIFFRSSPLTK